MQKTIINALIMLLFTGILGAQPRTVVAASDSYPPYVDLSLPGQGLSVALAREAMKSMGYELEFKQLPWSQAEAGLEAGTFDLLPNVWLTDARKETQAFSDPYAENSLKFIKRKGDPFEYNGLPSLMGKSVGIIKDYNYGEAFMNNAGFKREPEANLMANLGKLLAHQIDLAVDDEIVARNLLARNGPKLLDDLQFTAHALAQKKLYVSSGLSNPRHREIIDAFNQGLARIKQDGTYDKILKSYGMLSAKLK